VLALLIFFSPLRQQGLVQQQRDILLLALLVLFSLFSWMMRTRLAATEYDVVGALVNGSIIYWH
jgi:hypothetical protein